MRIHIYSYTTKEDVYLAALRALKPSFETSNLQADDSTATLIVMENTEQNGKVKKKNNTKKRIL